MILNQEDFRMTQHFKRTTWGLALSMAPFIAMASEVDRASAMGLLVTLRPQAVPIEAVPKASVLTLDTPQARQNREHATWQRNHEQRLSHMREVISQAGVAVRALGSGGQALRVDLSDQSSAGMDAAARRLRLHPDVLDVVPNERLHRMQSATLTPNDPLFARQWHLQAASSFAGALNMPSAWAQWTGAKSTVNVAVVDSGVRYDHPDLSANLLPGYDFVSEVDIANDGNGRDSDASDPGDWVSSTDAKSPSYAECGVENSSWHGTAIAGLIGATSQNALGVTGVNWGAKVIPVRVAGKCGAVLSDLLDGLRWAAGLPVAGAPANPHPARVINLSYGGSGACNSAYQSTVNDLRNAGAILVVAAGNSGTALSRPADCKGVFAVAAARGDGAKSAYSSFGYNVALAAPGGSGVSGSLDAGVLTALDSGQQGPVSPTYATVAGTSFAAPLVAAVASMVVGIRSDLSVAEIESLLKNAVRPHVKNSLLSDCTPTSSSLGVCNCTTQTCGTGLMDGNLAITAALALSAPPSTLPAPSTPPTETEPGGGGGATGWLWGLALWFWVIAVSHQNRRDQKKGLEHEAAS